MTFWIGFAGTASRNFLSNKWRKNPAIIFGFCVQNAICTSQINHPRKVVVVKLDKQELREQVFEYIKAGEAHSILVGFSVDTVNGSDERLMEWCDRMVGYVIDAVDYRHEKRRTEDEDLDAELSASNPVKKVAKKVSKKPVKKS